MAHPKAVPNRIVNMLEAKTQLSRLVEAIETGAESQIIIARNGRPVARLTSLEQNQQPRLIGIARGKFKAPDCIDSSNSLIAKLFEQA